MDNNNAKGKSNEVRKKLESFYSKEKFFNGLLHESCENAEKCWKRLNIKIKKASKWNYFSLPYIGKKYKRELVVVGLNINKGGGRNLQEIQIRGIEKMKKEDLHDNDKRYGYKYDPGVIDSLKKGCKSIKFENGMKKAVDKRDLDKIYGGTLLWHRVAVYSKILLDNYCDDVADNSEELSKIYERIIFMDAIKCSPDRDRSKPTKEMEKMCSKYIFFKELEIIKPRNILIMSKPVAKMMREEYMNRNSGDFPCNGKDIDHRKIKIAGESVNVYYIAHPSRVSGTELYKELNDIKKKQV